jgi:hypothetical protein
MLVISNMHVPTESQECRMQHACFVFREVPDSNLGSDTTFLISSKDMLGSEPGSVVGIATGYGLDGPRIEPWWGRDFPHLSIPALGPTQPPVQWVPGISRG